MNLSMKLVVLSNMLSFYQMHWNNLHADKIKKKQLKQLLRVLNFKATDAEISEILAVIVYRKLRERLLKFVFRSDSLVLRWVGFQIFRNNVVYRYMLKI